MEHDVLIAGAGPVGLLLASELRLHDISVLVLERLTEPSDTIKAGALSARTSQALDRRGLHDGCDEMSRRTLEQIFTMVRSTLPAGSTLTEQDIIATLPKGGHFGGLMKLDVSRVPASRQGSPGGALVPQHELERILVERATELGAEVSRGREITGLTQDDDGVTVQAGGVPYRAKFLVGCDGGRSTVRKLAGFKFPGTAPTITGHQAAVDLADPEKLRLGWNHTPTGLCVHGPTPNRILTVEFDGPPTDRDAEVTLDELQTSLRRVSGTDVTITKVYSATRWTDNARVAASYRMGRVLLAGDAAHVHSPFGGQGLNTGLQDAMNLGWKLAAEITGWAPAGLLDSYTTERHPVGERVVANTRAQVALLRPDEHTSALRQVFSDLMDLEQVNEHLVNLLGALDTRYDMGVAEPHPLVGRFLADLKLGTAHGVNRLAELLRHGRGLLLDLTDDKTLREVARPWSDRVQVITATGEVAVPVLVRPDGYVAWAGGANTETARTALTTWFGTP